MIDEATAKSDGKETITPPLEAAQIQDLIDARDWAAVRRALAKWPVPEVADLLEETKRTLRPLVFRTLPRSLSSDVFAELDKEERDELLEDLSNDETQHLLATLRPDDRTELFEELPGAVTQKLLNLLSADDLREARQLLGYPEESVGRLMTPDYVAVRPHWTIAQALGHIRARGRDSETLNEIYVTDNRWKLLDALELKRFVLGDPEETVEAIMDHTFVSLPALADREEAALMMQRYDLAALPAVDADGILVGIVTFDDALDVAEEEATEDFQRVGGVAPFEESLEEVGLGTLYRKRVGWLLALVVANLFSGGALAAYEGVWSHSTSLMLFLPLLISSAGNTGAQAATLTIRALATGDLTSGDWLRSIFKEFGVAAAMGLTLALAVMALGFYRGGPVIGQIVALTMLAVVVSGGLLGSAMPFVLKRFGLDPATASAPLVTTLSDISGTVIYFTLAKWLLGL